MEMILITFNCIVSCKGVFRRVLLKKKKVSSFQSFIMDLFQSCKGIEKTFKLAVNDYTNFLFSFHVFSLLPFKVVPFACGIFCIKNGGVGGRRSIYLKAEAETGASLRQLFTSLCNFVHIVKMFQMLNKCLPARRKHRNNMIPSDGQFEEIRRMNVFMDQREATVF